MDTRFHIAFGVDDRYAPYVRVVLKSIGENNRTGLICIHLLTNSISYRNRNCLQQIVGEYPNLSIQIHNVDCRKLQGIKESRWPISAWFRIFLPSLLSDVTRVLYLDADTLVLSELDELFTIDMTEKAIAAVLDPMTFEKKTFSRCNYDPNKLYVCAGVMMMNLDYWREHGLTEKIIEWSIEHEDEIEYADQDAINYVCKDAKIILPFRFGLLNCFQYKQFYEVPYYELLKESLLNPVIVHYANHYPWLKDWQKHPFQEDWIKYNKMLRHPVRFSYKNKGWLRLKTMIWNAIHPGTANIPTKNELLTKNSLTDNQEQHS